MSFTQHYLSLEFIEPSVVSEIYFFVKELQVHIY